VSFTYDLGTSIGRVRLLADDRVEATSALTDEELQACLDLNDARERLAAAQALDLKAANRAWLQRITAEGVATDGSLIAQALAERAAELRRQEADGVDDADPGFDIAEMVLDDFGWRQVVFSRALREQA
jgi:hypothetical protein